MCRRLVTVQSLQSDVTSFWWIESCGNWIWWLEDFCSYNEMLLIVDRSVARRWWQAERRPRRRTAARVTRSRRRKGRHHHREISFRPLSMPRHRRVLLLPPPPSSWTWRLWTITEKLFCLPLRHCLLSCTTSSLRFRKSRGRAAVNKETTSAATATPVAAPILPRCGSQTASATSPSQRIEILDGAGIKVNPFFHFSFAFNFQFPT